MQIRVRFIHADGRVEDRHAEVGVSVMECAVDNEVTGIIGQCGGAAICATCHCFVARSWWSRLPAQDEVELELLEYVDGARCDSRLSCQIVLTPELDGIEIQLPESQF